GEKSGNDAGIGAIEGEQIIQVIEDDERIIDGADQEKQTEKPDIMTALPRGAKGAAPRRHVVARPEVGIVTLECPPGEGEDHKEEDFCGASGDSAECCAGDDEKKCAETGCQGLEITTLKKLSCAGKNQGEEGSAYVEHHASRMLKKPASFVLASLRPSTYLKPYASGLRSLRPRWTVFLNILRSRAG